MPYIQQDDREMLYPSSERIATKPSELNFQISTLIKNYWLRTQNYQGINDILGALEGAKLEFYRRMGSEYERDKLRENGDL